MMTQEQLPLNIEGLDTYQQKQEHQAPAWVKIFRQKAFAQFTQSEMPTVKDEEWKYTSIADFTKRTWTIPSVHHLAEDAHLQRYLNPNDINIVLVNGVLWGQLSNIKHLPYGLTVSSFNEAAAHDKGVIQETISKLTPNDTKSMLWMNQALFLDGAYINVEKGAVVEPLVHIVHVTSALDAPSLVSPRSFINVEEAAQVNILESHVSFGPYVYMSNAVCDMKIAANAIVQYCKVEAESKESLHVGTTRIWQERASTLEQFSFMQGALIARNNLSILLKGEGTNTIMNGFYASEGKQHVDNHTLLDIQQPNCTSYQLYKGLLNDASRAVFNGKIYVHSIAQKTNGYQLNKHLLLGKEARVDTKPQLEIFADDVKCTHGATIGQLSEEEIFYFQSRCITKEKAIQLLSKGFIDDIINTIKNDSIRAKLNGLIARQFPEVKL